MNLGTLIHCGYDEAKRLLKISDLYRDENKVKLERFSPGGFSREFIEHSQKNDYNKIFEVARRNYDFDLLLKDESILQFSFELDHMERVSQIRYAFYEVPRQIISYENFLEMHNLSYDEIGEEFSHYYDQYKSEAELKNSVTPIRYDFDPGLYKGLEHPISHLHIGHNNQVRLPIRYVISPLAFVAIVIRHVYRKQWVKLLEDERFMDIYSTIKKSICSLEVEHFDKFEELDFYIN